MEKLRFLNEDGVFSLDGAENTSGLYLPLAGNAGLKSAVTPGFGGDSKIDQEAFLLEPATIESLHNARATRNFWCRVEGAGCWSATGVSAEAESQKFTAAQDESTLTAGFMWQTVKRVSRAYRLESEVTAFVPVDDAVEILRVRIRSTADTAQTVTPVAAVPIYGRSADNIRDHRNVTSMLHRIRTTENGVLVKPTMSFDEKGHRENRRIYYVQGCTGDGACPAAFYPTVDAFIGEGGSFLRPRAVYEGAAGVPAGTSIDGREAVGGLVFPKITLQPGESAEYVVLLGICEEAGEAARVLSAYGSAEKAQAALAAVQSYWQEKVNVRCHTGDGDFDRLMRWVSFQPMLRRIYGCSFLPHHDYGRGGRGWRDLWQDCLSLLLMDPDGVGGMIKANFGGVRIDGTNATIIGDGDGNFIADRNGIARVWMDHALWPLMTTKLYIDQTGDLEILNAPAPYFKDAQAVRGTQTDPLWQGGADNLQRTHDGAVYRGTILEHLLIQHLAAFYEVGAHNICRLRGADWNDALDMAAENGESVAFTCAYAGNLRDLAALLRQLEKTAGQKNAMLLEEALALLADRDGRSLCADADAEEKQAAGAGDGAGADGGLHVNEATTAFSAMGDHCSLYENAERKNALLQAYARQCAHGVSGRTVPVSLWKLAEDLEEKAAWLMEHLRRQEWIDAGTGEAAGAGKDMDESTGAGESFCDGREENCTGKNKCAGAGESKSAGKTESAGAGEQETEGWFNSYYDNHGRAVEGFTENGVRMMLTGQVFAVMSGTAGDAQVRSIIRSADRYLYREEIGGYRLNTDFKELKFDMGRMFGFAYGEKENGAVFCHMAVMYANALYRRGFARAGHRALRALADASLYFGRSRMYPGIPEYFNRDGRGVYCYLTGAASWYLLTLITEVFGVRGVWGDLAVCPKLVREQFDARGEASISLHFAGKEFCVTVKNPAGADCGAYRVARAFLAASAEAKPETQRVELPVTDGTAILRRAEIAHLPTEGNRIEIELKPI